MVGTLVLVGCFHLATPLLVAFFAYLALTKLHFVKRGGKSLAVVLFLILVSAIAYGLGHFINDTVRALPEIADKAIPSVIQWAREYQIELPFTDYDSLKDLAFDTVKSQVNYLGNVARFARGATTQFIFVLVGCVVAISLFLNPRLELDREKYAVRNNLYSLCCDQIAKRFADALPELRDGDRRADRHLGHQHRLHRHLRAGGRAALRGGGDRRDLSLRADPGASATWSATP